MRDSIDAVFSKVHDPRVKGRCLHLVKDILFIAFCTLLSNGEDYEDMVEFAEQRYNWLKQMIELPNGIPSHDTFNRVLQIIDSKELVDCLAVDGAFLIESVKGKLVNFDGKKIKGASPKSRGNKGLYVLSAWVGEDRLCIGQKKVKDKSNEITAIPELIDSLNLEGATVSIDAIGCQSEIATKIIDAKADYLLAVKENQKNLFEEVSDEWIWEKASVLSETWEYDHGRYEIRKCRIVEAEYNLHPDLLSKWKGIKTFVRIDSQRTIGNKTTSETRFYISSEQKNATDYNNVVRGHWSIENQLHWHLATWSPTNI